MMPNDFRLELSTPRDLCWIDNVQRFYKGRIYARTWARPRVSPPSELSLPYHTIVGVSSEDLRGDCV
jgi:hypothetical protein